MPRLSHTRPNSRDSRTTLLIFRGMRIGTGAARPKAPGVDQALSAATAASTDG